MQLPAYRYFEIFGSKFSPAECSQIIALQEQTDPLFSELDDGAGNNLRDIHLVWTRRFVIAPPGPGRFSTFQQSQLPFFPD